VGAVRAGKALLAGYCAVATAGGKMHVSYWAKAAPRRAIRCKGTFDAVDLLCHVRRGRC